MVGLGSLQWRDWVWRCLLGTLVNPDRQLSWGPGGVFNAVPCRQEALSTTQPGWELPARELWETHCQGEPCILGTPRMTPSSQSLVLGNSPGITADSSYPQLLVQPLATWPKPKELAPEGTAASSDTWIAQVTRCTTFCVSPFLFYWLMDSPLLRPKHWKPWMGGNWFFSGDAVCFLRMPW